jgi:BRCT domain type II-containing protein
VRGKAAFIVGTGVGYVLGTRAGRQRFEKIKAYSVRAWQNPQVQAKVGDLEAKAADFAKTEAAALKGRVTENIRTAASARKGSTSTPVEPVERHATAPSYPASTLSDTTVDAPPSASPPGTQTTTGDLP